MAQARDDPAGPGPGDYSELEKVLPRDYEALLGPKDTQIAIAEVKRSIEEGLCRELGLIRVQVPLIVDAEAGVVVGVAWTSSWKSVSTRAAAPRPSIGRVTGSSSQPSVEYALTPLTHTSCSPAARIHSASDSARSRSK